MNFSEFNETIKSQLNNLTSHNRLPHAIIITGGNEELRNSVADYLCVYAVKKINLATTVKIARKLCPTFTLIFHMYKAVQNQRI